MTEDTGVVIGRNDQNGEYSPISEDQVAQQVTELFKIEKTLDDDALLSLAINEFNSAALGLIRSGVAFMVLKSRLSHGEYEEAVKTRGFQIERAREAVRVARMFGIVPLEEAKRLKAAQASKLVLLSKLPENEIKTECSAGRLDELVNKSWVDLREYVKNYMGRALRRQNTRDADADPIPDWTPEPDDPRWVTVLREMAVRGAWRAHMAVTQLGDMLGQVLRAPDALVESGKEAPADARAMRAEIARAMRGELQSIVDEAQAAIGAIDAEFPFDRDQSFEDSRSMARLKTSHGAALKALHAEHDARAAALPKVCHWKGRPGTTYQSVLASALAYEAKKQAE